MNKITTILILGITVLFTSSTTSKPITKEYLVGKKFVKTGFIMGTQALTFIDDEKAEFTIYDKKPFGYKGRYILENNKEKQYIKIINIEKFGAFYMLKSISNTDKVFEVKNSNNLKEVSSGTTFEIVKKK